MTKISDYIDTLDLHVDQTYRGNCPICNGKNTFTVTREHSSVKYNCYKNSCGIGGNHRQRLNASEIIDLHNSKKNAPESYSEQDLCTYTVPPYIVPYAEVEHPIDPTFLRRYGIDPEDVHYDIRQDRLVFIVLSEGGEVVDAVGRSLTGRQPKWLRYASSPVPYTWGFDSKTVVIVEDAVSAYVVGSAFNMQCTGLALLGTQLTDFHKWYINKYFDTVIVALDPDARDKTIKIARELNGKALNLRDDLKYKETKDLDKLAEMLYE